MLTGNAVSLNFLYSGSMSQLIQLHIKKCNKLILARAGLLKAFKKTGGCLTLDLL